MIAITAKPARGFWRCGVNHQAQRTLYPDDRFTAKQLAILGKEPNLVLEMGLPNPAPQGEAEDEGKGKGGKK